MSDPFQPTLETVIRRAIEAAAADLHVSIPARVEKVDLAKGLLDVKPLVQDRVEVEGEVRAISVPVITNVPIIWPGAGGLRITFPIAIGDTVLLVFSDRSLDLWLEKGGEVDPIDPRRHALSDAVALPGLRTFKAPWGGAEAGAITIGSEGGALHTGAWGDKVAEALEQLKSAITSAISGHTHLYNPGPGSPAPSAPGAASGYVPPNLPGVESSTVKIRG